MFSIENFVDKKGRCSVGVGFCHILKRTLKRCQKVERMTSFQGEVCVVGFFSVDLHVCVHSCVVVIILVMILNNSDVFSFRCFGLVILCVTSVSR